MPDLRSRFPVLYKEHATMVRRALRQLGVPPGSLDDAVQDVFVVLHRRIDDFEQDRSLKNWLWGIARGVASGYRRSQRRQARLAAALPAASASSGLPERGVAKQQAAEILDDFLGSLDADKCAVFVLSEVEGRRGPEIAELLDVNVNTVYARLRAARKRFDAAMARHRTPAARPVFAAWLPFSRLAWPAWLSKPAVAVGVSALAVTAAVPSVAVEPAESTLAMVQGPVVDEEHGEPAHRWPRAVTPRVRHDRSASAPAPDLEEFDEDEVIVFEEAVPVARRRKPAAAPEPLTVAEPEPLAVAEPEFVEGPPARPWGSTVSGSRPVHHPTLITPRQDFVSELWRIAMNI